MPQETGQRAYREVHEPPDGHRPRIHHAIFWMDQQEQATYEHAAESNPPHEAELRTIEGRLTYLMRLATVVERRYLKAAHAMPQGRLSPKAYQRRLAELESQRELIGA